jgi:hypothetical protein
MRELDFSRLLANTRWIGSRGHPALRVLTCHSGCTRNTVSMLRATGASRMLAHVLGTDAQSVTATWYTATGRWCSHSPTPVSRRSPLTRRTAASGVAFTTGSTSTGVRRAVPGCRLFVRQLHAAASRRLIVAPRPGHPRKPRDSVGDSATSRRVRLENQSFETDLNTREGDTTAKVPVSDTTFLWMSASVV